jgi:RodZ C-terminal domain
VTAQKGSSRVEVRKGSATGELLWEGTLSRGDEQPFEGKRLWLSIAKAQNVALTLNGEPVPDLGKGRESLLVTESGAKPAGGS